MCTKRTPRDRERYGSIVAHKGAHPRRAGGMKRRWNPKVLIPRRELTVAGQGATGGPKPPLTLDTRVLRVRSQLFRDGKMSGVKVRALWRAQRAFNRLHCGQTMLVGAFPHCRQRFWTLAMKPPPPQSRVWLGFPAYGPHLGVTVALWLVMCVPSIVRAGHGGG